MRSRKTGEYTRCRLYGGASTGPKTAEGLERCRLARLKHGLRSAAAVIQRKQAVAERKRFREESAILFTPWRSLKKRLLNNGAVVPHVGGQGRIAQLRFDLIDNQQTVANLVKQEICVQHPRIDAYQDRWDRMMRLIEARAASGAAEHSGVPGADTGLLVCRRRSIGSAAFSEKVCEWRLDAALLKEMRELEKQAAVELGWFAERAAVRLRPEISDEVRTLAEALTPQELRELEQKLLAARQKLAPAINAY